MSAWRIVCDVGGTNIRIGRSRGPRDIGDVAVFATASVPALAALICDYALRIGEAESLEGAALAAAGPVCDGAVELTNAGVTIEAAELCRALGKPVRLMNDLEAVAWALPHFAPAELVSLCDVVMPLSGPRLALNIGTGFGAALLLDTAGGQHVQGCEAGHMLLAGALAERCGSAGETSIEDVLSGLALSDPIKRAHLWGLGSIDANLDLFAAPTSERGRRFLSSFSSLFGQVCADLVLATGAWGGVYISGSVASAWINHADRDAFCAAFRRKGPMRARMTRTRVHHISAAHPALAGLAAVPLI